MSKKGFTPLLIVITLATALVGGYFLFTNYSDLSRVKSRDNRTKITQPQPTTQPSPTSDEIANWKTYTDKAFNYSIKYPDNWETYAYGKKPENEPIDGAFERFFRPKGTEPTSIYFQVSRAKETDYEYLEKTFKGGSEVKTIKVDDTDVLFKIVSTTNGKRVGNALFKNRDYVYQISALDEDSINIFNQILSTLKFLP